MNYLHTVVQIIPKVQIRRICLAIKSFFSWWAFPLFSCPEWVIRGWYCKEKLDANHTRDKCGGSPHFIDIILQSVNYSDKVWMLKTTEEAEREE